MSLDRGCDSSLERRIVRETRDETAEKLSGSRWTQVAHRFPNIARNLSNTSLYSEVNVWTMVLLF